MGKLRFNYRSEVLGHYVDITVVYPSDTYRLPETDALKNRSHGLLIREKKDFFAPGMKFQTVYLMHGGGDDDTLTYRYTNAELFAQRNHVMLVTPNIANTFGADACYGVPYQTFVTEELPLVIQTLFASSPKREDNFIMGYAMGGNVALAAAIAVPPNRISDIIRGRRDVTADTAIRLGRYFGTDPRFWLNLQAEYDMRLAETELLPAIRKRIRPLEPQPA